jgi:CoA:oxalate CoA-transferase
MTKTLEDLVVLDFSRVLAGPFCTMMLCDLGATVIKVERPDSGDDSRTYTPFVKGESAYFMSINRGKKSITLDLKHPKGKEIALELAKRSDVLVENFKPGVMDNLGLGYEALKEINPRLVYASISGFGYTGPYSERPAYDLIIQGMGGIMSITGPDEHHPTKVGSSIADIFAGLFAAIGILSALHNRELTGRGQWVDVAMLDAMVAVLENAVSRYLATGNVPKPIGNRHPSIAPFCSVETADGFINIACGNDELWRRFCRIVGLDRLADDPRFLTNADRVKNFSELEPLINEATRKRASAEWLKLLEEAKVPCGPINDIASVVKDPQVAAREMLVEVLHPVAGALKLPGVPIKLSGTPASIAGPAPLLGQHTEEVLSGMLGMGRGEIEKLKEEGAI